MDIDRPAGAGDGPAKPRDSKYPNVVDEAAKCLRFIQEFEDDQGNKKYLDLLQRVANREEKVVTIELDDVLAHNRDESFVQAVLQNTRRYQTLFAKAIDTAMPAPSVDIRDPDVLDVLREQRMQNAGQEDFPVELMRRFEVHIKAPSSEKALPLRDVKAKYVGHLVTVKGIVTRMSEVRPLMRVATYVCDVCGYEIYQEVDSKEYMPLFECSSPVCKQNAQSKSGKLFPQIRGSRFVKFQDLKLQELPSEVPVGSIPRSLNVVVRGELTRRCVPGDIVTVTGIFLVTRQTGFRAINAGLTADTYLEVTHMEQHKKTHADLHISEDMLQQVEQRAQDVDIYTKLSKSIAPEIFGLEDVKRALLLLLVGGQTRVMSDGMKIRGDINILLLGDPGVAKSQLLKHISSIAPRGAYTTGKGSSGVGLTAAVIRDPITGEMTLEGGALVLADMGICCIDEFDKMEDSDRTAIHEVMEQQTVSIAKAGITTTLNARTSVLAAANPVMGRYNPNRTPEENIGLPTALLSRFDLTFILRDTPDEESDKALAQHVTVVHKTGKHPALSFEPFAPQFLRAYVNRARQYEPTINKELTDFIVGTYVEMRAESESVKDETRQRFCTARSLLSILRLSQALARLRFADEVDQHDVQEAVRLLFVTKQQDQDTKQRRKTDGSVTSEIYDIFVGLARLTKDHSVKYSALRSRAEKDGFTREDVEQMLTKYSELNVLHRSREGQTIRPVERGAE